MELQLNDRGAIQMYTPIFKLSYPHVFSQLTSIAGKPLDRPRYEVTAIFNKDTEEVTKKYKLGVSLNDLNKAVEMVYKNAGLPSNGHKPLRPGSDKPNAKEMQDGYFASLRNTKPFQVIDAQKNVITEAEQAKLYGGCYCRAYITIYAYDNVSKGVGISIKALQKIEDGTPFGTGGVVAAEVFGDLTVENVVDSDLMDIEL